MKIGQGRRITFDKLLTHDTIEELQIDMMAREEWKTDIVKYSNM